MARNIATLFLLFTISVAWAQPVIRGRILDDVSGQAIENANIVLKGTVFGAASDEKGVFSLPVQRLPVVLVISEIRYHSKTYYATGTDVQIRLEPKVQMLDAVTIQEERIQSIHPGKKYYAYDFEFYEDFILVLAFTKSRKQTTLFVLRDDGSEVYKQKLNREPESFYKDFMGNVHLLTTDSAFQVYYDYVKVHLLYSMSKLEFLATMLRCKAQYKDAIILNLPLYRGLESNFYAVNEQGRRLFYSIADSVKRSYIEREYDLKYFLALRKMGVEPYLVSVKTLRENLDYYRQIVSLDWMDSQILKPVFAPLYTIDDSICIFDYTHDELVKFNSDLEVCDKIKIDFHKDKNWSRQIIIDETWQDVYTTYLRDGITHITKLDKNTFDRRETILAEGLIYIDKIKIRNGHAYFLHKNHFRNTHRMIYRMQL